MISAAANKRDALLDLPRRQHRFVQPLGRGRGDPVPWEQSLCLRQADAGPNPPLTERYPG